MNQNDDEDESSGDEVEKKSFCYLHMLLSNKTSTAPPFLLLGHGTVFMRRHLRNILTVQAIGPAQCSRHATNLLPFGFGIPPCATLHLENAGENQVTLGTAVIAQRLDDPFFQTHQ